MGYTLDEIPNDITKLTPASFEPTIDYTVVKIPRWDFEKFKGVDDSLGVQMKSVGEAMAFGRTFKEALQKTLRSLEQGRFGLGVAAEGRFDIDTLTKTQKTAWIKTVKEQLRRPKANNIFYVRYAFQLGLSLEDVHSLTKIDPWFLFNLQSGFISFEAELKKSSLTEVTKETFLKAKQYQIYQTGHFPISGRVTKPQCGNSGKR